MLPHERVQQFTAEHLVHMPVPQTQEQSAVTDSVNPPISITAVEVVDSFSVSEEVATLVDMTTLNTSSTSTNSSAPVCNREETTSNTMEILSPSSTSTSRDRLHELASMLDSCLEQLTPLAAMGEETERIEMLTKRMMETPLPVPPLVEPPLVESADGTSAKRRRRTRYTPLPGIMENAVYLAPSARPPTRCT